MTKKYCLFSILIAMVLIIGTLSSCTFGNTPAATTLASTSTTSSPLQDLQAQVADLSSKVTGLNDALNQMNATVNSAQSSSTDARNLANTASSTATDLQVSITSLQAAVTKLQQGGSVGDLATQEAADIKAVQTSLATLQTTLTALQAQLKADEDVIVALETRVTDLEAAVKALQNTTTTPTTSPTTTPATPTGTVTAAITGNPFTNATTVTIPAIAVGSLAQSGSFTMAVTNSTLKTVTSIQLALGIVIYDNTNSSNPTPLTTGLPAGVILTISSGGNLSLIWTEQATGLVYIKGYTNQASGGILGSLGNLTQDPGTQNYTITVTITVTGANACPALLLYPTIKVIAFTRGT